MNTRNFLSRRNLLTL